MRRNLGKNLVFPPLPVVVIGTYDKTGKANAMTAAWSTIYDFGQVFVSVSKHKTTKNIQLNKCFTLAFATKATIKMTDYFGLVSGDKQDKIARAKAHVVKSNYINAPIITEYPLTLECKLKSLRDGNLIGDIVNVSVDEKYMSGNKIQIDKMQIVTYDMTDHSYRVIGKRIAKGFEVGMSLKK